MSISKSMQRTAIAGCYDSVSWKRKVREMPDYQVYAIYKKFMEEGRFEKKKEYARKEEYRQLTIFDFL